MEARRNKIHGEPHHLFWSICGVVFFAAAYRWFLVPAGLYGGGFTGIAQLIKLFLQEIVGIGIPEEMDLTGVIFWCINLPLFALGYKCLGGKFLYRTILAVFIQSLLLTFIPAPSSPLLDDLLLNCMIGGALSGLGVGMTLRAGGSGGGLDILGMYCAKKLPDFSVGKINVLTNALIYLAAAIRYDFEIAAYSMVFAVAAGFVTDCTHDQNIKIAAFIVTENKTLGDRISKAVCRGVTSWEGWGEHSRQGKTVHMVVVSKYELQGIKWLIKQEDPQAFVMILLPETTMGNFEKRLEVL